MRTILKGALIQSRGLARVTVARSTRYEADG